MAVKSYSLVIGAKQHWYSTEQILKSGLYNNVIKEKGLVEKLNNHIAYNIRIINKRIINVYLKPSMKYAELIKNDFRMRFKLSINEEYLSIHLRIGNVDNEPFKKYINKTEIRLLIEKIKHLKKRKIIVISDSILIKKQIKQEVGQLIYTDYNIPCHSRNIKCLNHSLNDIMMLKYSKFLILTRGSTFSLFASYFSKCTYDKIIYVGHDYEHNNYYK